MSELWRSHENSKYQNVLISTFVMLFICTDFIAASKVCRVWSISFEGRLLFFPISYFFDDVLTEIYGYSAGRKTIWFGFFSLGFANLMSFILIILPPDEIEWDHQEELQVILGQSPRLIAGSLLSFVIGKFINIYLVSKSKIRFKGKYAWQRSFSASIISEGIDTVLFFLISFIGEMESHLFTEALVVSLVFKFVWLILMIPVVHFITTFLEHKEGFVHFDTNVNYNPFIFEF